MVDASIEVERFPRINWPDGFGGNPCGARGVIQARGDWIQVLDGLELYINPAEFRGGGGRGG